MRWLRSGAILIVLLLVVSAGLFTLLSPGKTSDSAEPNAVLERVKKSEGTIENIKYRNVTMVGDRILVQAEYTGDSNNLPQQAAAWHQLAEDTANKLYTDIVRNRGVEVQVYQNNTLRAVAVAGI